MTETPESLEQRVRERAYSLWQQDGCPDGRDHEFWEPALSLVASEAKREDASKQASGPIRHESKKSKLVDQASSDSFPASDPPSFTGVTGSGGKTAGNP